MKRVLGGSGICNGSQRRHGILTGDNGWEGASGEERAHAEVEGEGNTGLNGGTQNCPV